MDIKYIESWLPEATVNYKEGGPAVGLGLIITVFFRDGHRPEVRRRMVECVDRFYAEFGTHLKKQMTERWSGITEKNYLKNRQRIIDSTPEEIFSWDLMSAPEDYLASDCSILIMGKRVFHNDNNRSVIKLTFPLNFLQQPDGAARYQAWLLWLCDTFAVESGYAGLAFVLPQDFNRLFPYEFALAQRFSGVMVDSLGFLDGANAVEGIKGACWYTILGTPWLEKLGGEARLMARLSDTPEIDVLLYRHGVVIKAGETPPPLGEVRLEGPPLLLVKVNQLIKPVRQDGHNGLHFYSMEDAHQFDKESSMAWYARFDEAGALLETPDDNDVSSAKMYTE
ncbi:DUF3396 domain-containing protein [Klebsiella aerogenes]|uniref:DUF3396 domain-containing protein n=1 Tax=Klebsiella aerogenes TaxID=548 RepID=UPI00063C9986|nr:DUF3396 domain-containing protein [Klebsiella aerogenes]KLF73086.1 mevalonate pyrophosphate decarboxylase [Klebsiella aerogenes]